MKRHNSGSSCWRTSKDVALSLLSPFELVFCAALRFYSYGSCSTIFSPLGVKHIAQLKLSVLMFPICKNKSSRSQLLRPLRLTSYLPRGMVEITIH